MLAALEATDRSRRSHSAVVGAKCDVRGRVCAAERRRRRERVGRDTAEGARRTESAIADKIGSRSSRTLRCGTLHFTACQWRTTPLSCVPSRPLSPPPKPPRRSPPKRMPHGVNRCPRSRRRRWRQKWQRSRRSRMLRPRPSTRRRRRRQRRPSSTFFRCRRRRRPDLAEPARSSTVAPRAKSCSRRHRRRASAHRPTRAPAKIMRTAAEPAAAAATAYRCPRACSHLPIYFMPTAVPHPPSGRPLLSRTRRIREASSRAAARSACAPYAVGVPARSRCKATAATCRVEGRRKDSLRRSSRKHAR